MHSTNRGGRGVRSGGMALRKTLRPPQFFWPRPRRLTFRRQSCGLMAVRPSTAELEPPRLQCGDVVAVHVLMQRKDFVVFDLQRKRVTIVVVFAVLHFAQSFCFDGG